MKHNGDLVIKTEEDADKYKHVTEVTGYVDIYSNASLDAPNLQTVGGSVDIYSNASLDAPNLQTVGENVYINSDASLPNLQTVGGYVSIHSNASLDAPNLQTVGGYVYIYSNAKLDAPNLQTVGGYVYIYSNTSLPRLQTVGGYVIIHIDASLDAPKVKHNQGFEEFLKHGFVHADGILTKFVKKRGNIYTTTKLGTNETIYVIKSGEHFAHGETIKEARDSLQFKKADRDTSQYEGMSLDTVKKPIEWAVCYSAITGACETGVKHFMSQRKLKKSYTLEEIIQETKGAFGHEQFKQFFMRG